MTDGAASRGTRRAMSDHVAGETAYDRTLEAALGFRLSKASDGGESKNGSDGERTHGLHLQDLNSL